MQATVRDRPFSCEVQSGACKCKGVRPMWRQIHAAFPHIRSMVGDDDNFLCRPPKSFSSKFRDRQTTHAAKSHTRRPPHHATPPRPEYRPEVQRSKCFLDSNASIPSKTDTRTVTKTPPVANPKLRQPTPTSTTTPTQAVPASVAHNPDQRLITVPQDGGSRLVHDHSYEGAGRRQPAQTVQGHEIRRTVCLFPPTSSQACLNTR